MKILIQNARTLDPVHGTQGEEDVLIGQGKILRRAPKGTISTQDAARVIRADGMYLFPGFVDFHTHLFSHGSSFGLDADRLLESGVVCAADMGSAGWVNYPAMHTCDMVGKRLELKAYLNLSPVGQPGRGVREPLDEAVIDPERMEALMAAYPGEIVGIKVRISRDIVGELGLTPLQRAVEIGQTLNLPVCVHTTDPPASAGEIISLLRPGDIYSHTYQGKGRTVLDEEGRLDQAVLAGQRRGVLMEVGNGRVNFDFTVAQPAMAQGLYPDIISSDSTPATFHRERAMWDLSLVASKFLNLGMPLADVLRAITLTPAQVLGVDDRFGSLAEGRPADLVLCRMEDEPFPFRDAAGNELVGPRGLVPQMTLRWGEVVFESKE